MSSVARIRRWSLLFYFSALVGCGSREGRDDDPPVTNAEKQEWPDEQPVDANSGQFNMDALASIDSSLQSHSGKGTIWTTRLTVNGVEKWNLALVAFAEVSDAMRDVRFRPGDAFRCEMTVSDKDNPDLVLATNRESVAAVDEVHRNVWENHCQGIVSFGVKVVGGGLWTFEGEGGGQGKITLPICDFTRGRLMQVFAMNPKPDGPSKDFDTQE